MKILSSDSFKTHCDKFNNLIADHHQFRGKMNSSQAARKLIKSVKNRITKTTSELIHSNVKPLTREGVVQYLIDYENRNGGFVTPAMKVANLAHTELTQTQPESNNAENLLRKKPKCTELKCISQTHTPEECFSKPKNFGARDKWIAEMDAKRRNGSYRNFKPSHSGVSGMKKVSLPSNISSANATFASFHVVYGTSEVNGPVTDRTVDEDSTSQEDLNDIVPTVLDSSDRLYSGQEVTYAPLIVSLPQVALHNVFSEGSMAANLVKGNGEWALFDTGSSDHVFKSEMFFDKDTISPIEDKNN